VPQGAVEASKSSRIERVSAGIPGVGLIVKPYTYAALRKKSGPFLALVRRNDFVFTRLAS
jgi:hypothetical protein